MSATTGTSPAPYPSPNRPSGACTRCRRVKTKCIFPEGRLGGCRPCVRGGYECVFLSRAERRAEKHRSQFRDRTATPTFTGADTDADTDPGRASSQFSRPMTPLSQPPVAPEAANANAAVMHGMGEEELLPDLLNQCQQLLQKFLWPFSPFHWPTFQKKLANRTLERSLYYAMLASAIRASRRPLPTARFTSHRAASDFFVDKARAAVLEGLDHPSLADVQALLLVIILDWGSSHGTRAFMYLGMASRMAISFLPEADHRLASASDFMAAETARRTIWMVFMVEQFLSSGNGRIPAVRAEELPISLPCPEMDYLFGTPSIVPMFDGSLPPRRSPPHDHESPPVGPVGEFGCMIKIASIWNLVATWRYRALGHNEELLPPESQLRQLEDKLCDWRASLPTRYRDVGEHLDLHVSLGTGFAFGFAHCVYHCALVFLHRERLYSYGRDEASASASAAAVRTRDKAIEMVFASAERMIVIINTLEATSTPDTAVIFPIFMLYACFTAASAIAYISIKQWTDSRQVSFTIVRESLRILRSMKTIWPLVEEWYVHLSSMVKVLQDRAMGLDTSPAAHELPSEGLQYGHIRSRAQTPETPIRVSVPVVGTTSDGGRVSEAGGAGTPGCFDELGSSVGPMWMDLLIPRMTYESFSGEGTVDHGS